MTYFRAGSQLYTLVSLLSVVGEYPINSVKLLGNERVYKTLIRRLTKPERIREPLTQKELTTRLFTVSGGGTTRAVRLYKAALPILEWLGALEYYEASFWNHRFPGDPSHRERNFRVAESVAMCMRAGIEFRPYLLPVLQNRILCSVVPNTPSFYPAKYIKKLGEAEMNKTVFTRMVGALFATDMCFAVYNARGAAMKWSGMGEFKARHVLTEVARMNAGIPEVDSSILFGETDTVALNMLRAYETNYRFGLSFDHVYCHTYFVPMNEDGIHQLRILVEPNRKERVLRLLFPDNTRSFDRGMFEYDAYLNGTYVLSFLDGDIVRLIRFCEAAEQIQEKCEVLCFPHQAGLLTQYVYGKLSIKTIPMASVETALGIERRHLFEV